MSAAQMSAAPKSGTLAQPRAASTDSDVLDFAAFAAAPLIRSPFQCFMVPRFVPAAAARAACESFPGPDLPGVLPAPEKTGDDGFGRLLRALRGKRTTEAFSDKYGLKLSTDTLMVTLRARCRPRDGVIHTDSTDKVITALVYLNDDWSAPGGRLRLLRGPDDIEDMIDEVPPIAGTLLSFRRSDNSWHGHKPFDGVRRAIMLNWMTDAGAARREVRRHQISAGLKRIAAPFNGGSRS